MTVEFLFVLFLQAENNLDRTRSCPNFTLVCNNDVGGIPDCGISNRISSISERVVLKNMSCDIFASY